MTTTGNKRKRGDEIEVGDVIVFLGTSHLIAKIEPYVHPTLGAMVGIARASDGWGITLEAQCSYYVAALGS